MKGGLFQGCAVLSASFVVVNIFANFKSTPHPAITAALARQYN